MTDGTDDTFERVLRAAADKETAKQQQNQIRVLAGAIRSPDNVGIILDCINNPPSGLSEREINVLLDMAGLDPARVRQQGGRLNRGETMMFVSSAILGATSLTSQEPVRTDLGEEPEMPDHRLRLHGIMTPEQFSDLLTYSGLFPPNQTAYAVDRDLAIPKELHMIAQTLPIMTTASGGDLSSATELLVDNGMVWGLARANAEAWRIGSSNASNPQKDFIAAALSQAWRLFSENGVSTPTVNAAVREAGDPWRGGFAQLAGTLDIQPDVSTPERLRAALEQLETERSTDPVAYAQGCTKHVPLLK